MPLLDASVYRYLAVGVLNTLVGLAVIYFGLYALGLGNAAANALGYAVGVVVSFLLNKRWTFRHDGAALPAFLRFLLVLAVAYSVNLVTVLILADRMHMNRYLAQALGVPPYTILGYVGSRLFSFPAADQQRA